MRVAQSSHIQAHDYDPNTRTMTVQFVNGSIYQYAGVPQTEYDNFGQSSSPGTYFASKIKPTYRSQQITSGNGKRKR